MSNKKNTLHNIFPARAHKGGIIWPWTKWQRRNLSPKGAGYSLSVETLYRLDGPGFEPQRGWDLLPRPWGPPSLLYNGYRLSFPGVKRPGRGVNHPPPSSAEVKGRVALTSIPPQGLYFLLYFKHKITVYVKFLNVIGFRRGWTKLFRLLGYYSLWGGLKPTFRDYL